MAIYSVTTTARAVSVAQDVFAIVVPTSSRIRVREIRMGQYSDFGDAAAEILSVRVLRGFDTYEDTGGGFALTTTPVNLSGVTGRQADTGVVVGVNDTGIHLYDTGTVTPNSEELISDTWNIAAGWWYYPPEEECPIVEAGENIAVRITAPADALTVNATLIYERVGLEGN